MSRKITPLPKKYGCSKEQIIEIISSSDFTEEERTLFYMANGKDLDNPCRERPFNGRENQKYNAIVQKIKTRVNRLKESSKNGNIKFNNEITSQNTDQDSVKRGIVKIDLEKYMDNSSSSDINKEDYIKILDILKTPTFEEMLRESSPKIAIIIYLSFGYVDNKYYSAEAISNLLGIDKKEIIEIIKNMLLSYKNKIIGSVDELINTSEKQMLELEESDKKPYQKQ